jgi:signal transduction histidine kinase
VAAELLPPKDAPPAELQATLDRLAGHFPLRLAVRDADERVVASAGGPVPPPRPARTDSHVIRRHGFGVALRLPDGRWLVAMHTHAREGRAALGFVFGLALFGLVCGVGAYPLARRLTRRLERLRARVDELGRGDLRARVVVEGRDEVAALAESFNRSAERIEALVSAQRRVLAGASHELRSPLARIRLALELLPGDAAVKATAARDVSELDALIEELLVASRMDSGAPPGPVEEVDLLGLVAEEASRTGADVGGDPVRIQGELRLLRRLVRNVLENARRHGGGTLVEASVEPGPRGGARLVVADRGPGVPEADRERIFDPFFRPAGAAETGEGFGLGLSLVRQIARHHGGEARYVPRPGGGSRFEVDLPGLGPRPAQ